jgi:spermidine/putrescine transport system substrate-binding protein
VFITAIRLGQNPNKISDIDKVYAALREQRPLVLKYWAGTSEMQTLVANQEAWVGDFVGGRTMILKEQGQPVDYVIPASGARGLWIVLPSGKAHRAVIPAKSSLIT